MRPGPENKVKEKIKKLLDRYGVFHWPASASPYGVGGVSDRLAILPGGVLLAIEAKAPGKHPTRLQLRFGGRVQEAGGHFFVVDGDEALERLEVFLRNWDGD